MSSGARRATDKFMLRMPNGLRSRIKAMAALNKRSMTAEINLHLERVFPAPEAATGAKFGDLSPAAAPSHTDALQGAEQFHPQHQEC